ncbi:MAG: hypothetical protein NC302_12325, partial [Bacteroidales bacterium]|nr:hypothetical protein [Bacteroidales bacterium]
MRHTDRGKRVTAAALTAAMTLATLCSSGIASHAQTNLSMDDYDDIIDTYSIDDSIPNYRDYVTQFDAVYPDAEIRVGAEANIRYDEGDVSAEPVIYTDYEGMSGDSLYTSEDSLTEFTINVEEEGFYNLSLEYFPVAGKNSDIERSIFIDGELPYSEMALVDFYRIWKFDVQTAAQTVNGSVQYVWEKDNQGNDNKPGMVEAPEWVTSYCYDSEGHITSPLSVYLTKGEHTVSLLSLKEPMLIHQLILGKAEQTKSYAQVKADWDAAGAQPTSGQRICIEGEYASKTSSQMLYPIQDQSSPSVSPSSAKELLNNTIGGNSWRLVGQWIEWEFDVPESGYYNISLYDCQNYVRGIYVSRRISIDGVVPFQEMEDYGFHYAQSWREDVLSDDAGTPYSFYIEKGHHTLRMEAVLGDFSDIVSQVQDCVQQLNSIYREVIKITGVDPDTYRDYQLASSLPNLYNELVTVRDQLSGAIDAMSALTGKNSDKLTVLLTMRDQLNDLIEDEEFFVRVIGSYKINVRACGNWVSTIISQPLAIDRINITSADVDVKYENDSFFAKAGYECKRLFYSFIIDYNQIGNVIDENDDSATLTLWIGSGRDQANVIK